MPRGIYERKQKSEEVKVENVRFEEEKTMTPVVKANVDKFTPFVGGTIAQKKVERVRRYSDNKDHKGEGEPLCFTCGHRADMHYVEHRWTEVKMGKNLQGDFLQVEQLKRKPVYDGARPCQHACLCKGFE